MAYFKPITFPVTDKVTKQTRGCGLIKQLPKKIMTIDMIKQPCVCFV